MLNKGIKKLIVFLMLIYVVFVGTAYTDADIFAERIVVNNKFTAITLDFFIKSSFNNQPVHNLFHSSGIIPGGFDLGALKMQTNNDNKFNYRLKVIKINGDDNLCSNLSLKIFDRNFFPVYSGSLLSGTINSRLSKDSPKDYIFFISLDNSDPSLMNRVCEFNLDFRTYYADPNEQGGVFAQRLISNSITSGAW